jgi:hypothetical protein
MGQIAAYSIGFGKNEFTHYHHATQDRKAARRRAGRQLESPLILHQLHRALDAGEFSARHTATAPTPARIPPAISKRKSSGVRRNGRIAQDRGIMPQREWEFLPMIRAFSAKMAADSVT